MKDLIKKLVTGSIRLARNLFYKRFYRKQIKHKFLKPSDSLSDSYREDITKYWGNVGVNISTAWHKWYTSRNGLEDARYIPEDLYYCKIEPALNNEQYSEPLGDKAIMDLLMPDFKMAATIVKNVNGMFFNSSYEMVTTENAIKACMGFGEIVIKPTIDTGGGRNISFFDPGDGVKASEVIRGFFEKYGKDFIVQEPIKQHEEFKKMNPDSVNTYKVVSLLLDDGVSIASTHIRVGLKGQRVDNLTIGGFSAGVDENGVLRETGFTKIGEAVTELPNGYVFKGKKMPGYHNAIELIKKAHLKLGQFRLVSWDIAIEPDETPVLIEYNLFYQGINLHQLNNGPLFGAKTDEVLKLVF